MVADRQIAWQCVDVAAVGAVLRDEPAAAVEPRGGSFVDEPQRVGSNRLAHGGTHEVAGGCRRVVPGAVHLVVTVGYSPFVVHASHCAGS